MVINVDREGRHREDIITELVKYLRYRYELTERVLTHHAKSAADAMLGKMLELWHDDLWLREARRTFPEVEFVDGQPLDDAKRRIRSHLGGTDGHGDQEESSEVATVTAAVQAHIETEFLRRSDDGMLEHLAQSDPE
ncbi:hypothetical protein, partial [Streptomyces rochei]|uniref:hypothetical protein n=1 Tax=Streptomyces rochei TaxID=1928 RepID=UPI0022E999A3